jgi:putative Ca2+/H+ antiporter (TMEM165/GDT1 family)
MSSRSPSPSKGGNSRGSGGLTNLFSLLLSPAWVQTFIMTFLGEWGDRSQIATIAMAAGQDYWWVTLGAITGHACCTGLAVLGGRALAGKVSMRVGKLRAFHPTPSNASHSHDRRRGRFLGFRRALPLGSVL